MLFGKGKRMVAADVTCSQYYEGEWIDGERSGYGIMQWYDGRVYEGTWLKGKPHANGTPKPNTHKFI